MVDIDVAHQLYHALLELVDACLSLLLLYTRHYI